MKKILSILLGFASIFLSFTVSGQILTTLIKFNGTNGAYPAAGLIEARDGNFYGTTSNGGTNNNGTVFKMSPDGSLTTLVYFNLTNGSGPLGRLIETSNGNFYGTTQGGGTNGLKTIVFGHTTNTYGGYGTIFRMTPDGTLTTLVNFNSTNGAYPGGGLIEASDGNFYGTTEYGGTGGGGGYGTIYRMTPDGTLTTLFIFSGADGADPVAPLIQARDGNLYGTTSSGINLVAGTVFKLTTDGMLSTLFTFTNPADLYGINPYGGVIEGNDGNIYGTAVSGGPYNYGTFFTVTTNSELKIFVNFTSAIYTPWAGVIQASDGNFYGLTGHGGDLSLGSGYGYGAVFKVTPTGGLTTVAIFNGANGFSCEFPMVEGCDGNLYGTSVAGGDLSLNNGNGAGTVFKITGLNLSPSFTSLTLTNGSAHLGWTSVSNWRYRVQCKTNLADSNWTDLPGDVLATNQVSSKIDPGFSPERFYRLVLLH